MEIIDLDSHIRRRTHSATTIPTPAAPITPVSNQCSYLPSSGSDSRRLSITSSTLIANYDQSPNTEFTQHSWSESPQTTWPLALHMALPRMEVNDKPMSCAITSYLELARSMLSQGTPVEQVFGPDRPSMDLLFRPRKPTDSHSVCHFVAELCARIKGMETASKLGIAVMFVYLIRVSGAPIPLRVSMLRCLNSG
jgi:hypothetical protein